MPNGGTVPCCALCKRHSKTSVQFEGFCDYHQFPVKSHNMVCADLKWDFPFITKLMLWLSRNIIYAWVEIGYTAAKNPTLPMYRIEKAKLASFTDYASWTQAEREQAYNSLRERINREFIEKHGNTG